MPEFCSFHGYGDQIWNSKLRKSHVIICRYFTQKLTS